MPKKFNSNLNYNNNKKISSIMLVAGEISGDQIGENIVRILKKKYPNARIFGVVGPKMLAAGCEEIGNINKLSVMGLIEVIKHLPRILKFKKELVQYAISNKPDLFIGIDSPDFNLRLAHSLKSLGIKTIQYVSPSVWAWRQGRIKSIKQSVDHVCCLFPFEVGFYKLHGMPASFVGHPVASEYSLNINKVVEKKSLGLDNSIYVALLPGSRVSEVTRMLPLFLQVAYKLHKNNKNLKFLAPCAHDKLKEIFNKNLEAYPGLPIKIFDGKSKEVLKASDLALITSGTATLEALMAKTLMVVAYTMPHISYFICKRLVKTPYIALPNILAGKLLVPECIQKQARVDRLVIKMQEQISNIGTNAGDEVIKEFIAIHKSLITNSDVFINVIANI